MSLFSKSGSGGADGAGKLYQLRYDTAPASVIPFKTYEAFGDAQPTGLIRLEGARTGDTLTVLIESRPIGDFSDVLIVVPTAFEHGDITIRNLTTGSFMVITEDSLGAPAYDSNFQLAAGAQVISAGNLTELIVLARPTSTGDRITELLAVGQYVETVEGVAFSAASPAAGDVLVSHLLNRALSSERLLDYTVPAAVQVYSDTPVNLRLRVLTRDRGMNTWALAGEYTWSTQADGSIDYQSVVEVAEMPTRDIAGAGLFRALPVLAKLEVSFVGSAAPVSLVEGTVRVLGTFTRA